MRRAKEIMFLNESISPEKAKDLRLVTEVVSDANLSKRRNAIAEKLSNGPTQTYSALNDLLSNTYSRSLEEQLKSETSKLLKVVQSEDYARGYKAFKDNKEPEFTGE